MSKTTIAFSDNYYKNETGVINKFVTDKMLSDLELRLAPEGLPKKLNQKTLVLDPVSGQLVIGDGAGNPKVISCIKIIYTMDDLPVTGLSDMLYVALFEKAFAVWDSSNNAYVKIGAGDSGGAPLDKSVQTYPSVANFPLEGERNKIYITHDGKSYFFVNGKYRPLFGSGTDITVATLDDIDGLFKNKEEQKKEETIRVASLEDVDALFKDKSSEEKEAIRIATLRDIDDLFKSKTAEEKETMRIATLEEIDALFENKN